MYCLGTGGSSYKNKNIMASTINSYISLGGNIIDSAEKYNSGSLIGKFTKINRKKFYIISKIRPHIYNFYQIFNVVQNKLLRDLQTNYLNELVIHSAIDEKYVNNRINTWKAFIELKKKGIVKNIGVSTFNIKQIENLVKNTKTFPDTLHVEYSLYNHDEAIYNYCRNNKIKMYAFSPLAKRNGSKRNRILNRDVLKQLYQKYNCNYEKLVLSWLRSKEIIPILASSNKEHLKENFNTFILDKEDISICDSLQDIMQINKYNCTHLYPHIIQIKNCIRPDIYNFLDKTFPTSVNNGQGAKYDDGLKGRAIYNTLLQNEIWKQLHQFIYSQKFIDLVMSNFRNEIKTTFKDEFLLDIDNLVYQESKNYIQEIEDIVRRRKEEYRKEIPNTIFTRFNLSSKGDGKNQKEHRDHENRLFSGLLYFNNFKPENRGCTQFWSGQNQNNKDKLLLESFPEKNKMIIFLCNKHSIHNATSKQNTQETRKTIYFMASAHKSAWKYIQGIND